MELDLSKNFTFSVKDWGPDGFARVDYTHEVLGTVVKQIFIPLNLSEEEQRGAIIMQFPSTVFHSRWLQMLGRDEPLPGPAAMEGEFVYGIARPEDNLVEQALATVKV